MLRRWTAQSDIHLFIMRILEPFRAMILVLSLLICLLLTGIKKDHRNIYIYLLYLQHSQQNVYHQDAIWQQQYQI